MIKKERTYLQYDDTTNIMFESIVDKSLHLFVVNTYVKYSYSTTTGPWTLKTTQSFYNETEVESTKEYMVKNAKEAGYHQCGTAKDYIATKNKGSHPTWNTIAWLIQEYAECLLKERTKLPDRFYKNGNLDTTFKVYLVNRALKECQLPEDKLEKMAEDYLKNTGYEVGIRGDSSIYFRRTK